MEYKTFLKSTCTLLDIIMGFDMDIERSFYFKLGQLEHVLGIYFGRKLDTLNQQEHVLINILCETYR